MRLTRPAVICGVEVPDVRLVFADGALANIEGGPGVERLVAFADRDAGRRRVGEIAPVDLGTR